MPKGCSRCMSNGAGLLAMRAAPPARAGHQRPPSATALASVLPLAGRPNPMSGRTGEGVGGGGAVGMPPDQSARGSRRSRDDSREEPDNGRVRSARKPQISRIHWLSGTPQPARGAASPAGRAAARAAVSESGSGAGFSKAPTNGRADRDRASRQYGAGTPGGRGMPSRARGDRPSRSDDAYISGRSGQAASYVPACGFDMAWKIAA
jgi:hypothetical protein